LKIKELSGLFFQPPQEASFFRPRTLIPSTSLSRNPIHITTSNRFPTGVPKWRSGAGMTLSGMPIQLSENVEIRIVGALGRPEHLQQPVAFLAEALDAEAVLLGIDQAGEPLPQGLLGSLV